MTFTPTSPIVPRMALGTSENCQPLSSKGFLNQALLLFPDMAWELTWFWVAPCGKVGAPISSAPGMEGTESTFLSVIRPFSSSRYPSSVTCRPWASTKNEIPSLETAVPSSQKVFPRSSFQYLSPLEFVCPPFSKNLDVKRCCASLSAAPPSHALCASVLPKRTIELVGENPRPEIDSFTGAMSPCACSSASSSSRFFFSLLYSLAQLI